MIAVAIYIRQLAPSLLQRFIASVCCAAALISLEVQGQQSARPARLKNILSHVPGGNTVGGEVRERRPRQDGYYHIDTPRMIARLKKLHANNVNYLIWNSPTDWHDLRNEFLPAAQKAQIGVWVYLVPPHETYGKGKGSDPYRTDYEKWAEALATLSKKHSVLQAWAMDDFTWSMSKFTPQYVAKLRQITRSINPNFRFITVLHFPAITDKWLADYGQNIDGVMSPYIDLPYNDTQRVTSLDSQIDAARSRLDPLGIPLYVLLYSGRHLASPLEPTPQYVIDAMAVGLRATREQRIGGVISYGTPLDPHTPPTSSNQALDGFGRLSLAAAATKISAGDFAEASQVITVDPASPRYSLSFWHNDQWGRPQYERGLLAKQLLVDGKLVWQCDPALDVRLTWLEGSVLQGPVDLTQALKGKKTATINIRVFATKSGTIQPIDVSFDRLKATGFRLCDPGFETGEGWTIKDNGAGLLAAVDVYDPNRPKRVFDAVSKAYASFHR